MEAVGLTVGVVGLAGLFSTCLEAVDKVQTYLSFRTDSHVLDTRFKAAKVRFEKWGRRVRFEETMRSEDHHPALNDRDISAAVQDIFQIITDTTLCDASDASAHHTSRAMTPSDDVSLGSLRPRPHGTRRRKLVWTLWGKTERTEQVELFEKLVQQLHNLVPVDAVQGTRPVHELDTRRTDNLAPGLGTSLGHARPAELQRILARIEEANRDCSPLSARKSVTLFAADAFAADVFAPDVFISDVFFSDVFSANVFILDVFSAAVFPSDVCTPDIFSAAVITPDVFSTNVFTPDVFTADVFALSDPDILPLTSSPLTSSHPTSSLLTSSLLTAQLEWLDAFEHVVRVLRKKVVDTNIINRIEGFVEKVNTSPTDERLNAELQKLTYSELVFTSICFNQKTIRLLDVWEAKQTRDYMESQKIPWDRDQVIKKLRAHVLTPSPYQSLYESSQGKATTAGNVSTKNAFSSHTDRETVTACLGGYIASVMPEEDFPDTAITTAVDTQYPKSNMDGLMTIQLAREAAWLHSLFTGSGQGVNVDEINHILGPGIAKAVHHSQLRQWEIEQGWEERTNCVQLAYALKIRIGNTSEITDDLHVPEDDFQMLFNPNHLGFGSFGA
ncbi:hypothetical protein AK830_g4116 [Neonectria ditissima]|uniref:Prion-inhibition and propagation HeLo domain-containing protein n=1 Tax=Neonectria ditissima TaxID=78410 RepID=A0A0P7BM82_9HYPO|nr:hypothetical protein AK830_g4116 [Neonectria ditissima]